MNQHERCLKLMDYIHDYRKENFAEAKEWCLKSLKLREEFYKKTGKQDDVADNRWLIEDLADTYYEMGITCYINGDFPEAKEWCMKSEEKYRKLSEFSDAIYHNCLADNRRALSIICMVMGNLDEMREWHDKFFQAKER